MAQEELHPKRIANPTATRPKHPKKEYDAIIKAVWAAGWWCIRRGNNYILCYPTDDSKMISVPCTPKKIHTLNNVARKFRAKGVDC